MNYLSSCLGKSKAQVLREAVEKLYAQQTQQSTRTVLDRLMEARFKPLNAPLGFNAGDKAARQKLINAKVSKKGRN